MSFFTDLTRRIEAMRARLGDDIEADGIVAACGDLDDEAVLSLIAEAGALVRAAEVVRIAASGVAAERSRRELGHAGLAQTHGHRSTVTLIQELSGSSRSDAMKHIRLGTALRDGVAAGEAGMTPEPRVAHGSHDDAGESPAGPWHAPLSRALVSGALSSDQHDAILRGLGDPPVASLGGAGGWQGDLTVAGDEAKAIAEVWSLAAAQLAEEAPHRTVEELLRAARSVRDQLDPAGAERRFDETFEKRSFRQCIDADGQHRASIAFDDQAALWVAAALNAALRPRRGGPRFVDAEEKWHAERLANDPRSNEQLAYDLIIDTLRAGMLADAESVFGTRQVGIRLLITEGAHAAAVAGGPAVGVAEDDGSALPAWLLAQHACESGVTECRLDREGNPLHLGREQRLFSPAQRIALAIRDGGCRWRGCDRPPSYCEAHHIDEFSRDQGRTDVDRGILLCRFHHMQLHHGGWRITREGRGAFLLHPPGRGDSRSSHRGDPIELVPRLARRYAWGEVEPPPRRFRLAA